MNPLYTFLPPKAIPFWENFPKNRRFPSGGGRTRGGGGGMHSGGGADAGDAQRWRRGRGGGCTAMAARMHRSAACRGPPCPSSARGPPRPSSAAARHARHPHAARRARHPHAARRARHPPRPAVPVIRTRPAMPVIRRGPPCPSSARGPPCPSSARGPPSAARSAQTKKAPRGARDVFSDAARARAHTRRAGREKFFRCCAGAYAPPAGASGSVTSPIFSMRSSLTAVRPLRSA